jgi:tetratricopeptide (TPR) repeat protein
MMTELYPSIRSLHPPGPPWLYALISFAYCIVAIAIWKWQRWGLYAYIVLAIPVTFGVYLLIGTILDAFIGLASGVIMVAILIFLLYPVWNPAETPPVLLSRTDLDPDSIRLYWEGRSLAQRGEADNAIEVFTRSIESDEQNYHSWFEIGILYDDVKRDHTRAEQCYRKALEIEPINSHVLNRLGTCVGKQGRFEESASISRKVLKLYPRNEIAKRNLIAANQRIALTSM